MKNLEIVLAQQPGVVTFSNFEEVKSALNKKLSIYKNVIYTVDTIDSARKDKEELKALKKPLDTVKKEIKEAYSKPYEEFASMIDELVDMIKVPLGVAETFIKEHDDDAKKQEILRYAKERADFLGLGHLGDKIIQSVAFFNPKWLNASCKTKQWREGVDGILSQATLDLNVISTMGDNQVALQSVYYETLSMERTKSFYRNMQDVSNIDSIPVNREDQLFGYKVLKVSGAENQIMQLMEQIDIMGIDCEVIEDGMPQGFTERIEPDFSSFVAFDIEHTGTYGIDKGDEESEIIEIGAVKVVDGRIIETFDRLANPGRKIIPRVERLTHITNEMVKNEVAIDEVIRDFKSFVGDMILVGHNLKSCDIPHISRSARKASVTFDNEYFDTKILAKKLQSSQGWEEIKLPYLSKTFGISQTEAHRAWCDAEANAYVYLKLKEIYELNGN